MATSRRSVEKTLAPKTRRRVAARKAPSQATALYSADEKRQLILAHAAMRRTHDPLQLMSAWAGVAVALVVMMIGWWSLSGDNIVRYAYSIATETKELVSDVPHTEKTDFASLMRHTTDRLRVLEAQASNQQQALDMMADFVASSTPDTQRQELFQPPLESTH